MIHTKYIIINKENRNKLLGINKLMNLIYIYSRNITFRIHNSFVNCLWVTYTNLPTTKAPLARLRKMGKFFELIQRKGVQTFLRFSSSCKCFSTRLACKAKK